MLNVRALLCVVALLAVLGCEESGPPVVREFLWRGETHRIAAELPLRLDGDRLEIVGSIDAEPFEALLERTGDRTVIAIESRVVVHGVTVRERFGAEVDQNGVTRWTFTTPGGGEMEARPAVAGPTFDTDAGPIESDLRLTGVETHTVDTASHRAALEESGHDRRIAALRELLAILGSVERPTDLVVAGSSALAEVHRMVFEEWVASIYSRLTFVCGGGTAPGCSIECKVAGQVVGACNTGSLTCNPGESPQAAVCRCVYAFPRGVRADCSQVARCTPCTDAGTPTTPDAGPSATDAAATPVPL